MATEDPRETIARVPMSRGQIIAVTVAIFLNALDGFDVLSVSFAAPGIAAEWGIDRAALGLVLSMELVGMAGGSIALGNMADRLGRRPTILLCLTIMASGMWLATTAHDLVSLSGYRLLTGLGIGGMLAAINAVVVENANQRNRHLVVGLMAAGYPAGAVGGGVLSSWLLASTGDWRMVFLVGAATTTAAIPLVWALIPETVAVLAERRSPDALAQLNAVLRRYGHAAVQALPMTKSEAAQARFLRLFSPEMLRVTLLMTLSYFGHIMTFYFLMKWVPKLVADMGFAASAAGGVLVWANIGGMAGSLLFSFLTLRTGLRPLLAGALLGSAVAVVAFGQIGSDLVQLSIIVAIAGFFTNAAIVGLYALSAQSFPTLLRASGTGFVIGCGRGGAVLAPVAAGVMLETGQALGTVALVMASGSGLAAAALCLLPREKRHGAP
jgi:benzoate transport